MGNASVSASGAVPTMPITLLEAMAIERAPVSMLTTCDGVMFGEGGAGDNCNRGRGGIPGWGRCHHASAMRSCRPGLRAPGRRRCWLGESRQ
ncbi:hypothetical protein G6F64_014499 [Rhizopus arrhizus]|uniref:Uncharacterized protein n=1 Tax=Rhizopus oryzae TaxID=64495 RepID=A0A9P6WTB6_RHIOR|nr:hypothetical protein G6F64_014499 [Rhizopus arrhizus]